MHHVPGLIDFFIGMAGLYMIWDGQDSLERRVFSGIAQMMLGLILLAGAIALYIWA